MTGKEFEQICLKRMELHEQRGEATMGRYGVQATLRFDETLKTKVWQPIKSYPDFEGVLPDGRQFVIEAKVCGEATLRLLNDSKVQQRQLKHMFCRARFNVICFLLIYWAERVLKTRTDPAETWAFPVHPDLPFWESLERREVKSINRQTCSDYGVLVEWNALPGGRTPRPDVLSAVKSLQAYELKPVKF